VKSRKRLRMQYESLCRLIAEILADEDLVRITDGNPDPVGEYFVEAAEIVRRVMVGLQRPRLVNQKFIANVVSEVFKEKFEVDISCNEAARIASRIEAILT
jgi:hypothetical protein